MDIRRKHFREIQLVEGVTEYNPYPSNRITTGSPSVSLFLSSFLLSPLASPMSVWLFLVAVLAVNPFDLQYESCEVPMGLLVVYVVVVVVKEGVAGWRRVEADRRLNNAHFMVWNGSGFQSETSSSLHVGNILFLSDQSHIPADLLLLCTSSDDGCCYISTEELLGECDLQVRKAVRELQRSLPKPDSPEPAFNIQRLNMTVKVAHPSSDFNRFEGRLSLRGQPRASSLEVENLLVRGSVLVNTKWVLGLVVYTGMETKVWLDRFPLTRKMSVFQRKLSICIAVIAVIVLILSGIMELLQYCLSQEPANGEDFILYLICLGTVIPAAICIDLELIHIISLLCIIRKHPKFSFPKGNFPLDLANSNFMLLDKTGTLTEGSLSVQEILIEDTIYMVERQRRWSSSGEMDVTPEDYHLNSPAEVPIEVLQEKMRMGFEQNYRRLCECLVMCNSVVPVNKGAYFNSPSMDEKAIVEAAQKLGCSFVTRLDEECGVEMFDSCLTYHILAIRKFDPKLRRVRVLIQGEFDHGATLYIMGSYSVLKPFLKLPKSERDILEWRLGEMMKRGVRTVVMGYRRLEGEVVEGVVTRAVNARLSRINVEGKMELLLKELEQELSYLGIIGLTDCILPVTHTALSTFPSFSLQSWLLTGDTEANSLSCAYTLHLIPPETPVLRLYSADSLDLVNQKLFSLAKDWIFHGVLRTISDSNRESLQNDGFLEAGRDEDEKKYGLSIDGVSFTAAMKDKSTRKLLLCLLYSASFVCFWEMLPSHKRQVMKLLRKGLRERPIVVGVGDDGGNIPMLMEANVGVGVARTTDSRAPPRSDVSIPHISHLPLLLSHSRTLSFRLTSFTLLSLYSSVLLHSLKFLYLFLTNFTPTPLFPLTTTLYFSSLLVLFPALWLVFTSTPDTIFPSILTKRSILTFTFSGLCHALILSFTVGLAFFPSQHSLIELEIVYLFTTILTISQHFYQLQVNKTLLNTVYFVIAVGCSLGAAGIYYALSEEYEGGIRRVFTQANLGIGVGMGAGACVVASKLILGFPNSPNQSKIQPLNPDFSLLRKLRLESRNLLEFYQSSILRDSLTSQENSNFDIHPFFLYFKSKSTEKDYKNHYLLNILPLFRWSILAFLLEMVVIAPSVMLFYPEEQAFVWLGGASMCVLMGITFTTWDLMGIARVYVSFFLIFIFVNDVMAKTVHIIGYFTLFLAILVIKETYFQCVILVISTILVLLIDTLIYNLTYSTHNTDYETVEKALGVMLMICLIAWITVFGMFRSNKQEREQYQLFKETELRINQNDSILSFLLPDFVRKQVKDGIRYIAEDKDSVTVLFCEICDFDTICSTYSPSDLIELLEHIFQKIDELCATFGVAKIETVGKVYMACTGLSDFEAELEPEIQAIPHSQRALELAFGILGAFKGLQLQTGEGLKMKIGIHTGPVIAGVVGYHKPQFSLVGDTVNTASRMSTTIPSPNTIQVSESTYFSLHPDALPHEFQRKTVNVKGKGDFVTYIVKEATQVKIRRPKMSESSTESGTIMRKSRRRSSVIASLRESLELEDAISRNEFALRENVRIFPYFRPIFGNEQRFRNDTLAGNLTVIRHGLLCYSLELLLLLLASIRNALESSDYWVLTGMFCVDFVVSLCVYVRLLGWFKHWYFPWVLMGMHVVSCGGVMAAYAFAVSIDLVTLVIMCDLVMLYQCSGLFFRHGVIVSGVIVGPWVVLGSVYTEYQYVLATLIVTIQQCITMYFEEKRQRMFYCLSMHATREIANTERLLTQMLPIHAYEGLKHQDWVTDRLINVTLLYADICGFTAWASQRTPQEVVNFLGQIYTRFDQICDREGLYKVHTIGDCYVSMSATSNSPRRDPAAEAYQMVTLALEMTAVLVHDGELSMRIGLHTGDVVAGIVGSKVVRYDIYGKDVLVANRMESNGQAGRINVSEAVKTLLEERYAQEFVYEANKVVDVEEVGVSVQCYFLSRAEGK